MKIGKALRSNRDLPQIMTENYPLAALGGGGDYEFPVVALPNLGQGAPTGTSGMVAQNAMSLRWVTLVFNAVITGAATNNFAINILQRRLGLSLVATASATTIVASTMAFTPTVMTNIVPGTRLVFSAGTGAAETVTVLSTTATTATATFVNGHSGGYTIVSAPLATITFASGTNAVAQSPIQLAANPNVILGGDAITVQRVTNGSGLATPSVTVGLEWISSGAQ